MKGNNDNIPKSIEMTILDLEVNIKFSLEVELAVTQRVVEIITNSYEKKRLGDTIEKSDGKI